MLMKPFDAGTFKKALQTAIISPLQFARMPELTGHQLDTFTAHAEFVHQANQKFNLTSITDPAEMAIKHYLDSLTCCLAVDFTPVDRSVMSVPAQDSPGFRSL